MDNGCGHGKNRVQILNVGTGLEYERYEATNPIPHTNVGTGLEFEQYNATNPIPGQPILNPNDGSSVDTSLWDIYNQRATLADYDLSLDFNSNMDVLLVFVSPYAHAFMLYLSSQEAGLFSAVNTAFIIETYKLLRPDQTDLTNQLLYAILQNQPASSVTLDANFSPAAYAVRVNALFFTSLMTSLLAALTAMLVKQWVGNYDRGLRKISSRQIRARTRQYRYDGVVRWHMADVVALVPMILHVSLFLFFVGVIDFLFAVNQIIAIVSAACVLAGFSLYLFANILPLISSGAPFRSPVTQFLDNIVHKSRRRYTSKRGSRTTSDEKATDEAIEDPSDLIFGDDEPQARKVRLTRTLDVDAVIWLMLEADKTTERRLLDMCFEKLMSLRYIAHSNPSTFFRKEIPRTYRQMSATCLNAAGTSLIRERASRARLICRFLAWYLSIPRNNEQARWLRENFPFSEAKMLRVYANSAEERWDNEGLVVSRIAYRALFHLHQIKSVSCELCLGDMIFYPQFMAENEADKRWWIERNGSYVAQDLISITNCVFSHPTADSIRLDTAIQQALAFINADEDASRTFRHLKRLLDTGTPAYPDLATQWRDILSHAIGDAANFEPPGGNRRTGVMPEPSPSVPIPMSGYRDPRIRRRPSPSNTGVAFSDQPTVYPSAQRYPPTDQTPNLPLRNVLRPGIYSIDQAYTPHVVRGRNSLMYVDTERPIESPLAADKSSPIAYGSRHSTRSGRRRSGSS